MGENDGAKPTVIRIKNQHSASRFGSNIFGRIYYGVMVLIYLILVLLILISLGAFANKYNEVRNAWESILPGADSCILYGTNVGVIAGIPQIQLSSQGSCGFVLFSQVSIFLVALAWAVFSFILIIVVPNIVSLWRVLDFIMSVLTTLLAFSLSVTINAGLDKTCRAWESNLHCSGYFLIIPRSLSDSNQIYYYATLSIARNSAWVAFLVLLLLSVWYTASMIWYFVQKKRGPRQHAGKGTENEKTHPV